MNLLVYWCATGLWSSNRLSRYQKFGPLKDPTPSRLKKPGNKYSSGLTRQNGRLLQPEQIRILTFAIILSTRRASGRNISTKIFVSSRAASPTPVLEEKEGKWEERGRGREKEPRLSACRKTDDLCRPMAKAKPSRVRKKKRKTAALSRVRRSPSEWTFNA